MFVLCVPGESSANLPDNQPKRFSKTVAKEAANSSLAASSSMDSTNSLITSRVSAQKAANTGTMLCILSSDAR